MFLIIEIKPNIIIIALNVNLFYKNLCSVYIKDKQIILK